MKWKQMLALVILIIIIYFFWKVFNYDTLPSEVKKFEPLSYQTVAKYNKFTKLMPKITSEVSRNTESSECFKCITIAVVSCGNRTSEALVMLKSAIALTKRKLIIYIYTETPSFFSFIDFNRNLPFDIRSRVQINIKKVQYPSGENEKEWKSLFKECASLRLFLPNLLPETDSLLYFDTDVVMVAPIENIWDHFDRFNSSQMAAMVPEHEDSAVGWYNRFAKHPFYGKLGVNSGVMLMNLTRMRSFGWIEYLSPILKEFKKLIVWGDQDIINIIFHYHPDKLYIFGCENNYRADHCMYTSVCKSAEKNGVMAIHGSRGFFHNNKELIFKVIYRAWENYKLGEDIRQKLFYPMQERIFQIAKKTNCVKLSSLFLQNL